MDSSKPVLILGQGITGRSFINFFNTLKKPFITFDTRVKEQSFHLEEYQKFNMVSEDEINLNNIDFIACSPGFDLTHKLIKTAKEKKIDIKSDIQIFLEKNKSKAILITGTNGKSTVCSWLELIFLKKNIDSLAIGNIGKPVLDFIETKKDFFILEVSSFHLDISELPESEVAVLLNITPDHLDRHKDFESYVKVKNKILKKSKISIANEKFKELITKSDYFFEGDGSPKNQNLNAVKKIFSTLKINYTEKEILSCYPQLPHRMEEFHILENGISFIDDSKATNISSSLEGLKNIELSKKIIVICGGETKNQNFKKFCHYLNNRAEYIYFLGESSEFLKQHLDASKSKQVKNLEVAVSYALSKIKKDTILILSPGCSSLDMFSSFSERGNVFKDLVLNAEL